MNTWDNGGRKLSPQPFSANLEAGLFADPYEILFGREQGKEVSEYPKIECLHKTI